MATLEQLEAALRAADAAGNKEDAAQLAQAYAQMRAQQQPGQAPASAPDFSNVQSGSSTYRRKPSALDLLGAAASAQGDIRRGATHAVMGTLHGGAELIERGIRGGVNALIDAPQQTVGSLISGRPQAPQGMLQGLRQYVNDTVDADIANGQRGEAAYRDETAGNPLVRTGEVVGNTAMMALPAARAGKLPALQRYASAAGTGAVFGATDPIVEGESRATNAAWGGGLGLLGQVGGDALMMSGRAAASKAAPAVRQIYQAAKQRGIDLMPWQVSESPFMARARGVAAAVPFSGAKKRAASQAEAFDREVAKEIGEKLSPGETINPGVMGRAYDRMGSEFDRLFASGTQTDRQFLRDVATLRQDAHASGNQEAVSAVERLVSRVRGQGQGGLSGKTMQSLDRQARKLVQSGDPDRIAVGDEFRSALHNLFGRNAPQGDKAAFDAVRRQYANYKTVEPIVARTGGMAPGQLLGAVNATKSGRARVARGQAGALGELARIGQQMKSPPTSGTAENMFSGGALLGGAVNLPLTLKLLLAGNVGGRALDSGLLARYLMSEGRGQGRQFIAPYLRPAPMGALPYLPSQAAASEGEYESP